MIKRNVFAAWTAAAWLAVFGVVSVAAQTSEPAASPTPPTSPPAAAVTVAPAPAPTPAPLTGVRDDSVAAARVANRGDSQLLDYGMSWREAWHYGGTIMWFIMTLSILGGALTLYLFFMLRPAQIAPRVLLSELRERLGDGDMNAARRACENRSCALASVTLASLDYIRAVADANVPLLKDVAEAEGSRQAEDMQSQTQFLLDISVIAPMLGLLGTVLGMLKAFGSIAQDVTAAKPIILAQGVSQAIVTTIFGLMVAIASMILYAYFRRRTVRMVSLLETAAAEVLTALTARQKP